MSNPRLRFKRNDGTNYIEWEEKTLQDVSQYITTTGTDIKSVYVGTENMQKGCTGVVFENDNDSTVKGIQYTPDDVLISNIRPYLKKAWKADTNGICSTDVLCIRGTSEILSDFLYTVLSSDSFFEYVMQGVKGTKMPRGDKKHIMKMPVFIPCLEEQQKIADFLSAVDEVIAQFEAEVQNLEQQKKAAMQKIFSQEVRFKCEDGTDYPKWEETKLSSILCEYKETCEKDGTYEHISLTKEGVVPKSERYERDFLVTDDSKKYRVTHIDDICYNPANLKFGVICRNKYGNGIFSPIYVTFRVCGGFSPEFIEMIVTRHDFIKYALRFQQGTVYERMAVSPEDLLSIVVSIPCLEEQQKIADFLSAYDEAISYAKQELEHWKQLKKGLLQQMFV